jgi:hypothetical protein
MFTKCVSHNTCKSKLFKQKRTKGFFRSYFLFLGAIGMTGLLHLETSNSSSSPAAVSDLGLEKTSMAGVLCYEEVALCCHFRSLSGHGISRGASACTNEIVVEGYGCFFNLQHAKLHVSNLLFHRLRLPAAQRQQSRQKTQLRLRRPHTCLANSVLHRINHVNGNIRLCLCSRVRQK